MAFYDNLKFNEISLSGLPYVEIYRANVETMPEPVISIAKLARADGAKLYHKEYGSKQITIEGNITANDRATFLTARDTLVKTLQTTNARLEIPVGNSPREYTVTLQNILFSNTGGGYATFTITLVSPDPFGYDVYRRTIINGTTNTSSTASFSYLETIGGNYATPPYIRLVVIGATGGTGKYIELTNTAGDSIRVTRNWASDDTVLIDMLNKTLLVNGTAVDYTGTFWDMGVGDTSLSYADNLTTRTVGITATYKRRYL